MNKAEQKQFGAICQEVKDIKLNFDDFNKNLNTRLDSIDLKLGNHIEHIKGDIATINTNIDWIIKVKNENTNFKEDDVQNTNISWITKIIFLGIGLGITLVVELINKYVL